MIIAIDTETSGVDWRDDAFMVSIAYRVDTILHTQVFDNRGITMNAWYPKMDYITHMLSVSERIIMHNAKFDIQKLVRLGIPVGVFAGKWEDTQAIAHLIDEQQSTSLKFLARTVLGETTDEDEALKVWRRVNKVKKEEGYVTIPYEILAPYAAKDAEFTLRLYETLWPRLPETMHTLYASEKELTMCLLGIEAKGMLIDTKYVSEQRKAYGDKIYALKHRIGELAGDEFNPNSPKQTLAIFAERGIIITGTDKATLGGVDDELARLIVELREANKIKATYLDALAVEAKDTILHPNFRQHGTRTGRMSSGGAQN